jgi:hypothetical protein
MPNVARAQFAARVPNPIVATSGETIRVTVVGSFERNGTIAVQCTYPGSMLEFIRVEGGADFLMLAGLPLVPENVALGGGISRLTVESEFCQTGVDRPLFVLVFRALVSPIPSGIILPRAITVDGQSVQAELNGNTVTLTSPEFLPKVEEGIVGCYPNPMANKTNVVFTLAEATSVELSIRSLQGRLVDSLPTIEAVAGENVVEYIPEINTLANGPYLLQMRFRGTSVVYPFMVQR